MFITSIQETCTDHYRVHYAQLDDRGPFLSIDLFCQPSLYLIHVPHLHHGGYTIAEDHIEAHGEKATRHERALALGAKSGSADSNFKRIISQGWLSLKSTRFELWQSIMMVQLRNTH